MLLRSGIIVDLTDQFFPRRGAHAAHRYQHFHFLPRFDDGRYYLDALDGEVVRLLDADVDEHNSVLLAATPRP